MTASVNETNFKYVAHEGATKSDVLHVYNGWATTYDKDLLGKLQCENYTVVADKISDLYPQNVRHNIKLLDMGAGTGLLGQTLSDLGFTHLDALDPSKDMLEIARGKNVYENIYQEYLTEKPLNIAQDTYDVIVGIGMIGHNHAPFSSMNEMIRLVKPGGYVIIALRKWYLDEMPEYVAMEPMMEDLEKAGKWTKVTKTTIPKYYIDSEGVMFIYKVL